MQRAKKLTAFVCALLLMLCTCACSSNSQISIYDLQKAMLAADESLPETLSVNSNDEKAKDSFAYLSDMDYSKVQSFFLAYADDGMAYEIAAVELKNSADAADLKASLEKHLEGRVSLYKSYEPNQVERAENALIKINGNVVALIMCDNQSAVEKAFDDYLK